MVKAIESGLIWPVAEFFGSVIAHRLPCLDSANPAMSPVRVAGRYQQTCVRPDPPPNAVPIR